MIGPVLGIWLLYAIYRQIMDQPNLTQSWHHLMQSFHGREAGILLLVCLLMLVNWGIESRKWQLLTADLCTLRFRQAFISVQAGQAFALNTINRMGEPLGKAMFLPAGIRMQTVALSVYGSLPQIIVTLLSGMIGWIALKTTGLLQDAGLQEWNGPVFWLILAAGFSCLVLCILLYFRLSRIREWFWKKSFLASLRKYLPEWKPLPVQLLTGLLGLSCWRYLVFLVQYLLLMEVFGVGLSLVQAMILVSVLFLLLAIIPSIALAELGIRGKLSIFLFGMISRNYLGIMATATGIWIINLLLPALFGALIIIGWRYWQKRKRTT